MLQRTTFQQILLQRTKIAQLGLKHQGPPGKIVLATKFGNVRAEDGTFIGVNGKPDYVRSACEASLRRLHVDVINLLSAPG
jgi:aryl-alcohol dehydrogenase-like predicted oxidoreductase